MSKWQVYEISAKNSTVSGKTSFINILLIIIVFSFIPNCSFLRNNKATPQNKLLQEQVPQIINYDVREELIELGGDWYQVTARKEIEDTITPEKARELAINKARKKAIEYACGVSVASSSLRIQSESSYTSLIDYFGQISSLISQGMITEEEIISQRSYIENEEFFEEITVKVKVEKQKGVKDPYFDINAKLNKEHFTEGEKLELNLIPSQDCYMTILCIYSDQRVGLLLPNDYTDNFAKANKTYYYPHKDANYSIKLSLLPDKKEDTEMIMLIATKEFYNFTVFDKLSEYNTLESTLIDISKKLVNIPRNEMEINYLQYYIYK